MVRQNIVSAADASRAVQLMISDTPLYTVVAPMESTFSQAERLLDQYAVTDRLLPPDALILATALAQHAAAPLDAFITTDIVQGTVADQLGLIVRP
jgi:predicted nucleic acid-binding protein